MTGVSVERLMSTDLVTVDLDATAAEAASRMVEAGVSSVLVVDEAGRLEGLLTGTDFVTLVRANDPEDDTPVRACMTTDVMTVSRSDPLDDLSMLDGDEHTHLPVTDDERVVVGMLSTTDLTRRLAESERDR